MSALVAFNMWTRTDEITPGSFLVVVTALPEGAGVQDTRPEAESRVVTSLALAQQTRDEMVDAMRRRLESRGHTVKRIDAV